MSGKFVAQVDEFIAKTDKRMTALMRESLQRTVDDAQLPVAKGGRMRIDTGFLRASGQGSLSGMPTGPVRGESDVKGFYDSGGATPVVVELSQMKLGAPFFFGWTANYARYREAYDGFLEGAVQKWQQTVNAVTEEIKARIK
jgi:hypothetical protein